MQNRVIFYHTKQIFSSEITRDSFFTRKIVWFLSNEKKSCDFTRERFRVKEQSTSRTSEIFSASIEALHQINFFCFLHLQVSHFSQTNFRRSRMSIIRLLIHVGRFFRQISFRNIFCALINSFVAKATKFIPQKIIFEKVFIRTICKNIIFFTLSFWKPTSENFEN